MDPASYASHIDGFNMLPYLTGEVRESPRESFFYISDDGDILAIRMRDWKVVLMEQRAKTLQCWLEPFVHLRAPKIFHLRRDPFERADENSNTYYDWMISHAYIIYAMQAVVGQQIENFRKFPPRQKPASFNLDAVMRTLVGRGRRRQPLTCGVHRRKAKVPCPASAQGTARKTEGVFITIGIGKEVTTLPKFRSDTK